MADLTDLEITKLCAEAMEDPPSLPGSSEIWDVDICYLPGTGSQKITQRVHSKYDPLRNDAQAMALVKKFRLDMRNDDSDNGWLVTLVRAGVPYTSGPTNDLNRAICECVARIQLKGRHD